MNAADHAERHFVYAMARAKEAGIDSDKFCRSLVNIIVSDCLKRQTVEDVTSELHFLADNCDPDTDYYFIRP